MSTKDQGGPPPAGQPSPAEEAASNESALNPAMQDHIGRYLRHLYDSVVQEPVPDRFVQLLAELERKSAERK